MRILLPSAIALAGCCLAITVPTARYDNSRGGANTQETKITPANVATMITLGRYPLDGASMSQPLYIPAVTVSGASHNLIIAATMNNTVYAFDADIPGSAALWSTNFGATWASPYTTVFYSTNLGITSTPVVDATNGFVYVVTVNNTPTFTLRKLALSTGVQASSIAISGSFPGTGGPSDVPVGGNVPFVATWEVQRTALALANGNIYVGFGAGAEGATWHGWMFAYRATDLVQQGVLLLSPGGVGAGVWEPAPAVDDSGNLYFTTGNGQWDGTANYSQSVVKTNATLTVTDWFTPSNHATTDAQDADLSSGQVMLIPGTTLLTFGSKDARVWVIDSTNMGHLQGTGAAPQVFTSATVTVSDHSGIYGGTFFNSTGYFPIATAPMNAFTFSGSTFTTSALSSTVANFAQVGAVGTSNSGTNPILWAVTIDTSAFSTQRQCTLRAFNPATLVEYWNSGTIGTLSKFTAPLVANGRAYVSTFDSGVQVFGLPIRSAVRGAATVRQGVSVR
jgi:hypothetical protein